VRQKNTTATINAIPAIPPTTPPTIGPTWLGAGAGAADVWLEDVEDVVVNVVGETKEVVLVVGLEVGVVSITVGKMSEKEPVVV
jgi:hypothetical protein